MSCASVTVSSVALLFTADNNVIGASLSEPHTSGTALRKCVCYVLVCLQPFTINFRCEFKYFSKSEHPHALSRYIGEGQR